MMAYPAKANAPKRPTALPTPRQYRGARRATAILAGATLGVLSITAPAARAAPPGSGWDLVFADEFEGTSLDTMKWNYNYTWGRTHNHQAYMRESQVVVGNGVLD